METAERLVDKVDEIQAAVAQLEANFKAQARDYEAAIDIYKKENEDLQRELAQAHMRIEELSK